MKIFPTALTFAIFFSLTLGGIVLYNKNWGQQPPSPAAPTSVVLSTGAPTPLPNIPSSPPSPSQNPSVVVKPTVAVVPSPANTPAVPYRPPAPGQSTVIDLGDWEHLISFRPPLHIQEETLKYQKWILRLWFQNAYVNWYVQRIDDAVGDVNLDYYPVLIRKMPIKNGIQQTPEALLTDIRRNINLYINDGHTFFEPYNSSWTQVCASELPSEALGCYFYIRIKLHLTLTDDGAVVISDITPQYWIFTTVFAIGHRKMAADTGSCMHPITGNREFGYKYVPNQGYIFYTRGVDRVSDNKRALPNTGGEIIGLGAFSSSDRLWQSFQQRVTENVNQNGGEAIILPRIQKLESWEYSVKRYHHPSTEWIDSLPTGQTYPYSNSASISENLYVC